MIISYDKNPSLTVDQKLQSLIESIMLAFGEVGIVENRNLSSMNLQNTDINTIINTLIESVSDLEARVAALEE